jgi:type I restriction enzyme S subunit
MKRDWKQLKLRDICSYMNGKISVKNIPVEDYISTENMQPNKGGVSCAASVPTSGTVTFFKKGQILVSNIRPYFRKIWFSDKQGGCSNDVLCFEGNTLVDSQYLYYLLSQDSFFDYVMLGANGSKMPRGDKKQIMDWPILLPDIKTQQQIAAILGAIDAKITLNRRINDNLAA